MPRILCIANFFREHGGGVEQMAHNLAQELEKFPDCEVVLAAHGSPASKAHEEEAYTRLPIRANNTFEKHFGLPLLLPHPADLAKLRREAKKADAVLVHDCVYLTHLFALQILPPDTPAIVIKHTGEVHFSSTAARKLFAFLNRKIFPHFLRKSAAMVFVTQTKSDNFPAVKGLPSHVITNGIPSQLFKAPDAKRSEELLFVGRFVAKKGTAIIHEMAKIMPERQFTLAGFGPIDPREWGLDNVTCHWRPAPAEIAALYRRAHALVLPGETEGTPLVALEALCCETPVVIGQTGQSPDPELSSQMAFLDIDIEQAEHTAQIWSGALDEAIASSRPSRSKIVTAYGAQRMAKDYFSLLQEIGI